MNSGFKFGMASEGEGSDGVHPVPAGVSVIRLAAVLLRV